jgi:hypothetical protein
MEPVVDGLQQEFVGRMEFRIHKNVNDDAVGSKLASKHGVSAVPTMMLVSPSGTEIERWVGATSADELRRAFDAGSQ